VVKVTTDALADAAFQLKTSTRSCSAISTPASRRRIHGLPGAAGRLPNCVSSRPRRVENACATGSAAVHQGIRAIAAGAAKVVLVVGVEADDTDALGRYRTLPVEGVLSA